MLDIAQSFIWSLLISVSAIPPVMWVSHAHKFFDRPNPRKIHQYLTPRLGGIAIFMGFGIALIFFSSLDSGIFELFMASFLIFFVGIRDDIFSVSVARKLSVQLIASAVIIFLADIRITDMQGLFGVYEINDMFSYAISFVLIIGITNAINLIDGIDGLAGMLIVIISLTFGIYFYYYEVLPYALVAFCLAGGVIGFLRYNIYKAKIFMGDTGSLVSGFIISALSIQFIEMKQVASSPAIAIAILVIPIFDTTRVFTTRILKGGSPFKADQNHIHHKLLRIGMGQLYVVLTLCLVNLLMILFVTFYAFLGNTPLFIILFLIALLTNLFLNFATKKRSGY